jgi:hypothetical protein
LQRRSELSSFFFPALHCNAANLPFFILCCVAPQ